MFLPTLHASGREQRLLHLKIGQNFGTLVTDTGNRYIKQPLENGNVVQAGLGIPAAGIRALFEAGDAIFEGVLDREIDLETSNRVMRDIDTIAGSTVGIVTNILKPTEALKNAGGVVLAGLRIPQSIGLDLMDAGGGFDTHTGVNLQEASSTDYGTSQTIVSNQVNTPSDALAELGKPIDVYAGNPVESQIQNTRAPIAKAIQSHQSTRSYQHATAL